jgi:hypothetical protein
MRVAGELPVPVHRAEVEAEDDLADPVALGLRGRGDLLEALALDVLGHDHTLAAELGHHARDDDEGVAPVEAGERAVVRRLQLVVQLLDDARSDLLTDGLHVHLRGDPLCQAQQHPQVLHVGAHRVVDARVLDLDRDVAAVVEAAPVDLSDRGGGDGGGVELGERAIDGLAQVLLDHLSHPLVRDRRRRVAQRGELRLELLAVLLRHQPEVEEREHLPDLHRGALHPAEHRDDLLRGLDLAPLEGLVGALLRPDHVRGLRAGLLDRDARRGPSDARESLNAPGWKLLVGHGRGIFAAGARVGVDWPRSYGRVVKGSPVRNRRGPATVTGDEVSHASSHWEARADREGATPKAGSQETCPRQPFQPLEERVALMRHINAPKAALALAAALTFVLPASAGAETALVELRVESATKTLDPGTWYVTGKERARKSSPSDDCDRTNGRIAVPGPSPLSLVQSGSEVNRKLRQVRVRRDEAGLFICEIGSILGRPFTDPDGFAGWTYWPDYVFGSASAEQFPLSDGDRVLWEYADFGSEPANTGSALELKGVPPRTEGVFTARVVAHAFDGSTSPANGAAITGAESATELGDGRYRIRVGSGNSVITAQRSVDIRSNHVRTCSRANLSRCPKAHGRKIVGSERGDELKGTRGFDKISSRAGDDRIDIRRGGKDAVRCGAGDDVVLIDRGDRDDRVRGSCERIQRS